MDLERPLSYKTWASTAMPIKQAGMITVLGTVNIDKLEDKMKCLLGALPPLSGPVSKPSVLILWNM